MASREFVDLRGRRWTVWEVQPALAERRRGLPDWRPHPRPERRRRATRARAAVQSKYASGWLVFETVGERRRLVPIPADWEHATDDALATYCAGATEAGPPRRLIE